MKKSWLVVIPSDRFFLGPNKGGEVFLLWEHYLAAKWKVVTTGEEEGRGQLVSDNEG